MFFRLERASLILSCSCSLTDRHVIGVVVVIVNRFLVHDSDGRFPGDRTMSMSPRFPGRGKATAQNLQPQKKIAGTGYGWTNRACLIARQVLYVQRAQLVVSRARDDRENVADHRLVLLLVVVVCSVAEVPPSNDRITWSVRVVTTPPVVPPPLFLLPLAVLSLSMGGEKICDLKNPMTFHY